MSGDLRIKCEMMNGDLRRIRIYTNGDLRYNLDFFFLQLQQLTGVRLYEKESVIIFDEVQLLPKARHPLIWGGKWHAQYAPPEQTFVLELG